MCHSINEWSKTFDNIDNLRPEFIKDLKTMEEEAPNHYRQYVLNSFEELSEDDYVFSFDDLLQSKNRDFVLKQGFGHRVMGFDIARFGNDKSKINCSFKVLSSSKFGIFKIGG